MTRPSNITLHAFRRIEDRFPDFVPEHLAHELSVAIRNGEYEFIGHVYKGKDLVRVEFANVAVYAMLGHGNTVVSVLAPGMVAFTPWGKIKLPPHLSPEPAHA